MRELEKGQKILFDDVKDLLTEIGLGYFNDFNNGDKYPAPKMAIAEKLHELRQNVINGKYD